ncbi:DISARM system phospholipase D-like protein DrmC [Flaviflexus equikiangi]|uniref:DISARM system phospholipase D-like protein DrmC n=1 Tax=Flaviflexus equikiangi TaxID=2758573 RepID=A0ABS2TCW0_9ACTO|nr:DISARM system phospholipase D-like protein DrmC [Flaviflexus equikiangi]MBM9432489.1 DISARM system phospholipase D-like protein DrmC [Flaviflexus equikiangi]
MDELLVVIAELGLELHPDRVRVVASKIEGLGSVEQFALARPTFGPNTDKTLVTRLGQAWHDTISMSPRDVATALRGASATAVEQQRRGSVELAWTGPSSGQVPVRHTEQVLMEVINSAQRRLFVVSFVAYQVKSISGALNDAAARGVQIDVLLESSTAHGGKVDHDSAQAMRRSVPSARLLQWSAQEKGPVGQYPGVVHAKCAVADGQIAFITSANLTSAAMERNMELGVLVTSGSLPEELHNHLDALIATKVLESV